MWRPDIPGIAPERLLATDPLAPTEPVAAAEVFWSDRKTIPVAMSELYVGEGGEVGGRDVDGLARSDVVLGDRMDVLRDLVSGETVVMVALVTKDVTVI